MIPKSIFRKGYTYLFLCLSGLVFPIHILSQTPQAGIASQPDHQDGIVISCAEGAMSFTGFQGGLFDAPKSYAFFVIRAGDTLVGRPRADANVWDQLIAGNEVLDTDQVFVRAFDEDTATGGGNFSDSQPLQLDIRPIPTPTLLSDTPANVFCDGQLVRFTTLPDTAGLLYSFLYLYGVLYKIPRATIFNFSQEIQMGPIAFGTSQQLAFTDRPRFNNLGVSMALSVENFDFGLQYNFPFRKQNEVYAPSLFELYVSFNFTPFRRNNRGLFKRLQTDNYLSP
jgi:hypothetical protein